MLPVLVLVAIAAAVLAVVSIGPTPGWLPRPSLKPRVTAGTACWAAAACDVVVLATAALTFLAAPAPGPWR